AGAEGRPAVAVGRRAETAPRVAAGDAGDLARRAVRQGVRAAEGPDGDRDRSEDAGLPGPDELPVELRRGAAGEQEVPHDAERPGGDGRVLQGGDPVLGGAGQ